MPPSCYNMSGFTVALVGVTKIVMMCLLVSLCNVNHTLRVWVTVHVWLASDGVVAKRCGSSLVVDGKGRLSCSAGIHDCLPAWAFVIVTGRFVPCRSSDTRDQDIAIVPSHNELITSPTF